MKLLRVQIKRNQRKVKTVSFVTGHIKKECTKYYTWRAKKGMFFILVCSEVNLASIPRNTWWLDSGTTTHISVSMRGCLSYRKPSDGEKYIFMGDEKSVEVEVIGHFRLLLGTDFYLELKDTPSLRQNLVSVSVLNKFDFHCSFGNNQFSLSLNSNIFGTGSLSFYVNLYLLDTIASYNEILHVDSRGTKRKLNKKNSARL